MARPLWYSLQGQDSCLRVLTAMKDVVSSKLRAWLLVLTYDPCGTGMVPDCPCWPAPAAAEEPKGEAAELTALKGE